MPRLDDLPGMPRPNGAAAGTGVGRESRLGAFVEGPGLPWMGLAAGVVATLAVWAGAGAIADRRAADDLARDARNAAHDIEQALGRHVDLVGSLQAFLAGPSRPDRARFHGHVAALDLRNQWPAVEALAFAPLVAGDARAEHESGVRAEAASGTAALRDFAIRPAGERPLHLPVTYAEPIAGNEAFLGQDFLADPDRRQSAIAARDTGRVHLVPDLRRAEGDSPAGIGLVAAVYRTGGRLLGADDRRIAHAGQIAAVVRLDELVRTALGDRLPANTTVALADLGSGPRAGATPRVLVRRPGAGAEARNTLTQPARLVAAGRTLEVELVRPVVPGRAQGGPLALLVAGLVASLGGFAFLRTWGSGRREALRLAERLSERVVERERDYRVLVDQLREIVVRVDRDGLVSSLNPAWERLTGYRVADAVGRPLAAYVHPEDRDSAMAAVAGIVAGTVREASWTARFVARGNEVRWLESRWSPAFDVTGAVAGAVGTLADVTDRIESRRDLQHRAQHDPLTGLPNRILLEDRFAMALAQAARDDCHVGVLYVDLEGFKRVNETCGHDVGDELLCAVAARLRGAVRGTDTVARVGGDEFVVLLPGASHPEVTHRVASTIATALAAEIPVGQHRLRIVPSVGVAAYPHDGDTLAALLAAGDAAMVRARSAGAGAGRVEVHAEVLGVHTAPPLPAADARGSVGRNEIAVRFAPQRELASGRVVGATLTLAWHGRADGGSPSRFLPVSEEAGLIVPLGQWAMLTALRECHAWNARGDGAARVMLEVSMRELQQANFAAAVERAIVRSDVDAADVWIAVEPRVALRPAAATAASLRDLAALGCLIGVEDVAGVPLDYASVAADLPFGFVVVGRQRWTEGARRAELPFLQAARARGWRLLADDARTATELDLAARLGFSIAQGPAVGAPMTAELIARAFSTPRDGRDDRDASDRDAASAA
jgi:diguanylate cyclase (GGDEF)-like protein/PAS domain S-box-containing protein